MPEAAVAEATPDTNTQAASNGAADSELAGLIANRDSILAEKKKIEAEKKRLEKLYEGIDPDEARRLKAEREKAENERLAAQGNFEALKQQLLDQHSKQLADREAEVAKLNKALYKNIVERDAIAAISATGAPVTPLLPHVTSHLRAVEVDGEYTVQIVDAKGNPRIGDAKGGPMTLAQLLEEYKANPDFQRLFPASSNGGSGAPAGQSAVNAQRTLKRAQFDAMSPSERMAHVKAGGAVVD